MNRRASIFYIAIVFTLAVVIPVLFANAQCPNYVDIAFLLDTSGSMMEEWNALCGNINAIITNLAGMEFNINYQIYALQNRWSPTDCSGGVLPQNCVGGAQGSNENWGAATADKAQNYPWRAGATRMIIPISDEGPYCGDPCDANDTASITNAIAAANNNNVFVFPIRGNSPPSNCADSRMNQLVSGTTANDKKFLFSGAPSDMANDISAAVIMATWDADGDCFVSDECPCDPANPPPNPICPGGKMRCGDLEDDDPIDVCTNPDSWEGMICYGGICPPVTDPPTRITIDGKYVWVCSAKNFPATGICVINCEDNFDNNQDGKIDSEDPNCPLPAGLVPCGRQRDSAETIEREDEPCTICHLFLMLKRIVDFLIIYVVVPTGVLMIVLGGETLLTASGDIEKINRGKKIFTAALIGILIFFTAWIIVNTVLAFLVTGGPPAPGATGVRIFGTPWNEINCPVGSQPVCP